jgi:hypothetical protein
MNILATFALWERDVIAERTREAMRFMKRGLRLVWAVSFGFDLVEGRLVPTGPEMGKARVVLGLRGESVSYHRIADKLNGREVATKGGGRRYPKDGPGRGEKPRDVARGPHGYEKILIKQDQEHR